MKIKISGKNIDIGDSLREFAVFEIEKYIGNNLNIDDVDASIAINKDHKIYEVEVLLYFLHLSKKGFVLRADGLSCDAYKAVTNAITKLESRVQKYKQRIKNKERHAHWRENAVNAMEYILSTDETQENEEHLVIAEQEKYMFLLSVSEAVMKLELGDLRVVMFKNIDNNRINTVYRRNDGHIGWMDYQAE